MTQTCRCEFRSDLLLRSFVDRNILESFVRGPQNTTDSAFCVRTPSHLDLQEEVNHPIPDSPSGATERLPAKALAKAMAMSEIHYCG